MAREAALDGYDLKLLDLVQPDDRLTSGAVRQRVRMVMLLSLDRERADIIGRFEASIRATPS